MMILLISKKCTIALFFIVFSFCLFFSGHCLGQGPERVSLETTLPKKLNIIVGKSIIVESLEAVKRVSLTAPEIADAMVLTPHQIYLIGKTPGTTNLTLWKSDEKISAIFDLEVSPDISRLKEKLHEILPEEKDIRVTAIHDSITLSGTVSGTSALSQVLSLAEPFAPKKVINLLEVSGIHQVMLEVRVSEMSRTLLKRLGFNFNYVSSSGRSFGLSLLNNLTVPSKFPAGGSPGLINPGGAPGINVTPNINGILRFFGEDTTWTTFIDALKEEGLLKILAEPTLITLSGKTASFLAGGEFPVPVPQTGIGVTTITIEFKQFGVALNFTPTVLSSGKINMVVAPEVSELDFSNAVTLQGFTIPSLTTRRVSTSIELADGQSFAIAGLLQDKIRETVFKFPVLGDIPILGALFRSSSFQKDESELVIIATPHLVKPLDMSKQTLPTDQYREPNDFEFYLMGLLEGKKGGSSLNKGAPAGPKKEGGLEGNFGHIIPE